MLPKKRRENQWRPAIAVKQEVYTAIRARSEQLGIPMSSVVERLVNDAICGHCGRSAVLFPGARHCGADECVAAVRGAHAP